MSFVSYDFRFYSCLNLHGDVVVDVHLFIDGCDRLDKGEAARNLGAALFSATVIILNSLISGCFGLVVEQQVVLFEL